MKQVLVYHPDLSIRDVIRAMELQGDGFLAIVDEHNHYLGCVTDREIRRAILNNRTQLLDFMNRETPSINGDMVQGKQVYHKHYTPVLSETGKLLSIKCEEITHPRNHPNKVVIMAGGLGRRLGDLTHHIPKPMLPLGHKPILHIILDSFLEYGFTDFFFCVNYKAEVIREYFGNGEAFGANITYIEEADALGTAGALSLIEEKFDEPFFLVNGDLITSLNFESLLNFHLEREGVGTMCIHEHNHQLPYGVVNTRNGRILSLEEKPYQSCYVNAGIYVLNPEILRRVPYNQPLDMTVLFDQLVEEDQEVNAYIINEFWADIGHIRDYEKTRQIFSKFGI